MINLEFLHRLKILLWAAVKDDIRHCLFEPPITLKIKQRPWKGSGTIAPALEIALTFQQPRIYLPYAILEAYERRDWAAQQWDEWQQSLDQIPF